MGKTLEGIRRVLKVARKPTKEEYLLSLKIFTVITLIVGTYAFAIRLIGTLTVFTLMRVPLGINATAMTVTVIIVAAIGLLVYFFMARRGMR